MVKVFNEKLKKIIKKHDIISFDVFDTLIKRNCNSPRDIFYIVEKQYNKLFDEKINDFYQKRVNAESKARLKHFDVEDITIDEIYSCIDLEENNVLGGMYYEEEIIISYACGSYDSYHGSRVRWI